MKAPLFGRIAIIGAGAIGGSLAAALMKRSLAMYVAVYDISLPLQQYIREHSFAHEICDSAQAAAAGADIIVLAVPPESIAPLAALISPAIKDGTIVTDVASIKRQAIQDITHYLSPTVPYVPGHPIAGSEKSGAQAIDADMFVGRRVILTPQEAEVLSEPVAQIRTLWEYLGAQVELMPADLHDRIYAYVSHLPQLAAFATKQLVHSHEKATAGVMRLSQSNVVLWTEISFANADFIREALDEFSTFLTQMHMELLENADEAPATSPIETPADTLLCSLVALCLVATTLLLEQRTGVNISRYSGNGFKDMVAAAGNSSDSVLGAISSNPREVGGLLKTFISRLAAMGVALSVGNKAGFVKAIT